MRPISPGLRARLGVLCRTCVAVGYPIYTYLMFITAFNRDAFSIFDPGYLLWNLALVPVLLWAVVWGLSRMAPQRWFVDAALALWVLLVTFGHFARVAEMSAGV